MKCYTATYVYGSIMHVKSLRKHEMKKPVKEVEAGTVPFSIRLNAGAKAALDKEAKAQGRPSANLAQWIIVEWLREKGLVK
jgi:hypothetical protein